MGIFRTALPMLTVLLLAGRVLAAQDGPEGRPAAEEAPDRGGEATAPADSIASVRRHSRPSANPHLRDVSDRGTSGRRRGSFAVTLGLGLGRESIAAPGAASLYSNGRLAPTLLLGAGWMAGPAVRLGFDGFSWLSTSADGSLESVSAIMAGAQLYPVPGAGLYLHAAGGLGRYALGDDDLFGSCGCTVPVVEDVGFAWMLEGGYQVPVGRRLWLGPSLALFRMDVPGTWGYRERVIHVGLNVTYEGP